MTKKRTLQVAITSGDDDGIGPEVTAKALEKVSIPKNVQLYLWRSSNFGKKHLRRIDKKMNRITVNSWQEAQQLRNTSESGHLIDILSSQPPAQWVENMGIAGRKKEIDALVTAPLSKDGIAASGMKDCGHTEILKRTTKTSQIFMTFLGQHFNVVLLTGHISPKKAYNQVNKDLLFQCASLAHDAKAILEPKSRKKPLGLVGFNPHAGENGLIDTLEAKVYLPALKKLQKKGLFTLGPLIPDVCFQKRFWSSYSFYIASSHDQGLIPFKMVHGESGGVQMSLGLPFVRTSVDHGTAKDIFNKNKARPSSMINALQVGIKLAGSKTIRW